MVVYADPTVFSIFTLPMIDGSPSTPLVEPHSIVINERTAKKYFNTTRVVGKVMTFNDTAHYKMTGVIKDIPKQSHFDFDFFVSMSTLPEARDVTWLSSNFVTYVLLRPDANLAKFKAALQPFYVKHAEPELQAVLHSSFKQLERSGDYVRVNLIPLTDIHLHSNRVAELGANGSIEYVYIFSAIAAFILLVACVNFMNLSTTRSANRAKEVGVRKVLGSARNQLVIQFLIESVMITLVAAIIAFFIADALLPVFNSLSGKELVVTPQLIRGFVPVLLILVVIIGCLAGSYPALFLSAFQPIAVLKGKMASGFKGGFLRSSLVVFQFSISIFLIIGTLVIYNQLRYIRNKDIGYNREHILMVNDAWALGGAAFTLKTELQQLAGVESVSLADAVPTWNYGNQITFFKSQALLLD
jgi:putative ABC transport system permease protein